MPLPHASPLPKGRKLSEDDRPPHPGKTPAQHQGLTGDLLHALRALAQIQGGWLGVRPGSNFATYCGLTTPSGEIAGEHKDALYRLGLLSVKPYSGAKRKTLGGGDYGPYGFIPEFDLDFVWSVNEAGRSALSQAEAR